MTKQKKHEKVYEDLTARVIELMEEGGHQWLKPWTKGTSQPQNAVSKHKFTGGNRLVLTLIGFEQGYKSGLWATYKQWESIGAQVRKGEKGVGLIRVSVSVRCVADGCGFKASKGVCSAHPDQTKRSMFPVGFTAFHASQVDGFTEPEPETFDHDPIEEAEAFFDSLPSTVVDGEDAYFVPSQDVITMPPLERFTDRERYYATLAHEHVHWTGHEDRLSRGLDKVTKFGDPTYAREELVAELGSVFLTADLGIEPEPAGDHAAYLKSWLKALKDDPSYIWKAAQDAEKAVKYLHENAEAVEQVEQVA